MYEKAGGIPKYGKRLSSKLLIYYYDSATSGELASERMLINANLCNHSQVCHWQCLCRAAFEAYHPHVVIPVPL